MRPLAPLALWCAVALIGCGLLAEAAANPTVQGAGIRLVTNLLREQMDESNIPYVLEYDHGNGEHVWMLTIKDEDLGGRD